MKQVSIIYMYVRITCCTYATVAELNDSGTDDGERIISLLRSFVVEVYILYTPYCIPYVHTPYCIPYVHTIYVVWHM